MAQPLDPLVRVPRSPLCPAPPEPMARLPESEESNGGEKPLPKPPRAVCKTCRACPLRQAPGCFQWQLKRALERGGRVNNLPTGLGGFMDFACRALQNPKEVTAEEAVEFWMDNDEKSTIDKVLEFAREKHNVTLIEAYHELLLEHLTDRELHRCTGTGNPADCFHTCDHCPSRVQRSSSPEQQKPKRKRKRTPSSPPSLICNIILPNPQPPSSHAQDMDTFSESSSEEEDIPLKPEDASMQSNCPYPSQIHIQHIVPPPNMASDRKPPAPIGRRPKTAPLPTAHVQGAKRLILRKDVSEPLLPAVPEIEKQWPKQEAGAKVDKPPLPSPVFQAARLPPLLELEGTPDNEPKQHHQPGSLAEVSESTSSTEQNQPEEEARASNMTDPDTHKHSFQRNGLTTAPDSATVAPGDTTNTELQQPSPSILRPRYSTAASAQTNHQHQERMTSVQPEEPRKEDLPTDDPETSDEDTPKVTQPLFSSGPYQFFRLLRDQRMIRRAVVLVYLVIFVYHFLAMMLLTMCEDGGFQTIFSPHHNTYSMIIHRIVMFGLRIVGRVVTPGFCLAQLRVLASSKQPKISRDPHCKIVEMNVYSMAMVVLQTVFFMGFLLYLGAFFLAEERIVMEGVCNFEVISDVIVNIPWVNVQILLMLLVESVSVFLNILLIAVMTEFYTYENYVVRKGSLKNRDVIRRRWLILDIYCYLIPIILFAFVFTSFATGKPFTPDPSQAIAATDVPTWYFWVFLLSALTLLASSRNQIFKDLGMITNLFAVAFAVLTTVQPIGASIIVLLFTTVASHAASVLYSLGKCHLSSWWSSGSRASCGAMVYCIVSIVLLAVLCLATGWREVTHLGQFVNARYKPHHDIVHNIGIV